MNNLRFRRIFAGVGLLSVMINLIIPNLPNACLMFFCVCGVAYNDTKWRKINEI